MALTYRAPLQPLPPAFRTPCRYARLPLRPLVGTSGVVFRLEILSLIGDLPGD